MDEWVIRALVAFVCTGLGWLAGHRLALGRDKRKEYNESIRHIRQILKSNQEVKLKEIDDLEIKLGKMSHGIKKYYVNVYKPEMETYYRVLCYDPVTGVPKGDLSRAKHLMDKANGAFLKVCKIK